MYCKQCGEDDPSKFYSKRKNKCKKCVNGDSKARYHNLSEADKQAYIDNASKNYRRWSGENTLQFRFISARNRAKYKGLEFNITIEHIEDLYTKQEGKCYYSDRKMTIARSGIDSVSIDRVDSSKGYICGNVVLCTSMINSMKKDVSTAKFLEVVSDICKVSVS